MTGGFVLLLLSSRTCFGISVLGRAYLSKPQLLRGFFIHLHCESSYLKFTYHPAVHERPFRFRVPDKKKNGCSNRKKRIRSKMTPAELLSARTAAKNPKFLVKRGAKVMSPGIIRTDTRKAREMWRSLPKSTFFREIAEFLQR